MNDSHLENDDGQDDAKNIANLTQQIHVAKEIVENLPEGHIDLPGHLNSISKLHLSLFGYSGKLDHVEEAISFGHSAVSLASDGDRSLFVYLCQLATGYETRFQHSHKIEDLSLSIVYQEQAIDSTPEGHPTLSTQLTNLGNLYLQRYQWTEKKADVSKAISCQKKAIALVQEGGPHRPALLHTLGTLYTTQFECTGEMTNVAEAILAIQESTRLTPDGDPKLSNRLDDLASLYHSCYRANKELFNMEKAISLREKALKLSPDDHPDLSIKLYNLGFLYENLFRETGRRKDLDEAASNYSKAIATTTGIPSFRLLASKRLAKISEDVYPVESIKAYTQAVQLVAQSASLHETIEVRHSNLRHISNTSTQAAAFAFKIGRSDLALEWLEQGRGLVWSQLNDLRTPLGDLEGIRPGLVNDITTVAKAVEASSYQQAVSSEDGNYEEREKKSEFHTKVVQEWDDLLAEVRQVQGFEGFLKPLSSSEILARLPTTGLVVVINVDKERCDALALIPGLNQPTHIPLPAFSYSKAVALRAKMHANLRASGVRMRDAGLILRGMRMEREAGLKEILGQLWHLVAKPILEGLGYTVRPAEKRRIWWCTTGPLSSLPIHAAGLYSEKGSEAGDILSDFAISSYAPTIRALLDRSKNTEEIPRVKKSGLLLVSQPYTPGFPPIPKALDEMRLVETVVKNHGMDVHCLEGEAATMESTSKEMEAYSSVHFACHASQNSGHPLQSAFALHDGRLDLSSIIRKQLQGVELAFLSACQTSTGDESLPEEAVHLAAGMLAAGYKGVVATMWSIRDAYAPKFAEDFYACLLGSKVPVDVGRQDAAHALHYASQNLQRKLLDDGIDLESSLRIWVPYIHFGL